MKYEILKKAGKDNFYSYEEASKAFASKLTEEESVFLKNADDDFRADVSFILSAHVVDRDSEFHGSIMGDSHVVSAFG